MHIVLTDILACPRCGPEFGLVVQADEIRERNVREGRLGCANCREEYLIRGGVADLRGDTDAPPRAAPAAPRGEGWAYRLAALLGLADGAGPVLVVHSGAAGLDELAELAPHALIVAASADPGAVGAGSDRMSELLHGARLPLRGRVLRGAALVDGAGLEMLDDVLRALGPGGRLVIDPAPSDTGPSLAGRGLRILLDDEGAIVAAVPPHA